MGELIFVKLGGSVITDKNREFAAREDVIRRLAREIRRAREARPDLQVLLGHGSGSFGHVVGRRYRTHEGLAGGGGWEGYAQTGAAADRLNRIVVDLCLDEGLPVVSLKPSASAECLDGDLRCLEVRPLRTLLDAGLAPVVYGDVAIDASRGFTIISTETIFAYLAHALQPSRIVLVGMVGGVYTADPLRDPDATLLPEISVEEPGGVAALLGESHGVDVTGGMMSKVRAMVVLAKEMPSLCVQIISGDPGVLERALVEPQARIGTAIRG